ncbi:23S rRNA (uracil(1939)-C(5))-methyltransferase RlmD [Desulfobacterota bacterium M19]
MTTVTVDKIIPGGLGLARDDHGLTMLIPFVLPQEVIKVNISRRHRSYATAEALEIIRPHPDRCSPPCPSFGRCGGCHLMHAAYHLQKKIKLDCLREALVHSKCSASAAETMTFTGCPVPLHYRQRLRLQVDDRGCLGFFKPRSHQLVTIESCLLAEPALNIILAFLSHTPAFQDWAEIIKEIELFYSPLDKDVIAVFHLQRPPRPRDRQRAALVTGGNNLLREIWFSAPGTQLHGPYSATQNQPQGINFKIVLPGQKDLIMGLTVGGFCQVNTEQNIALIQKALDRAELSGRERVLDLYCGLGNFSLPMARQAALVTGMESRRSSIRSAKKNARHNNITNCYFVQGLINEVLPELIASGECFDLIVIDPPRQGCKDIIHYLPALMAEKILYISCDPATMIRDMELMTAQGYNLRRVDGIDMFPQTSHIEVIALLEKVPVKPLIGNRI